MSRYIDADELYEKMQDICAYYEEGREAKEEALSMVYHFHTADVEEVRHGKWRDEREDFGTYVCSVCNRPCGNQYNYCPNCGAKMDKEKEE